MLLQVLIAVKWEDFVKEVTFEMSLEIQGEVGHTEIGKRYSR